LVAGAVLDPKLVREVMYTDTTSPFVAVTVQVVPFSAVILPWRVWCFTDLVGEAGAEVGDGGALGGVAEHPDSRVAMVAMETT
jgi:hypothetical protein